MNGCHLLGSDFNHASVILESDHAKISEIGTVIVGRVACNKLARSKAEQISSRENLVVLRHSLDGDSTALGGRF
ncbi:hypothetical protein TNCV_608371 [Trichonephila clavipes]|nr:hypothetical protein TNCV_608371 [Trichonephila clavipes]